MEAGERVAPIGLGKEIRLNLERSPQGPQKWKGRCREPAQQETARQEVGNRQLPVKEMYHFLHHARSLKSLQVRMSVGVKMIATPRIVRMDVAAADPYN